MRGYAILFARTSLDADLLITNTTTGHTISAIIIDPIMFRMNFILFFYFYTLSEFLLKTKLRKNHVYSWLLASVSVANLCALYSSYFFNCIFK